MKHINTLGNLTILMEELLRLSEAVRILGVHRQTLRNWDAAGKIKMVRTADNQRRVPKSEVERLMGEMGIRVPILYARVSTQMQKDDLERQTQRLRQAYPEAELIFDIRSGLKFDRKGFLHLLEAVRMKRVSKVVVVYEDLLARFGVDLVREVLSSYGTELEVLEASGRGSPETELVRDLVSIITSFSARLYGLRSHKTKKLLQETRKVLAEP